MLLACGFGLTTFTTEDQFDSLILDSGFATSGAERHEQLLSFLGDSAEQAVLMLEVL